MRIKEIHEILQKLTNGKVTQNDIAKAIETSRANVSKLFANNSFINDDKVKKIEQYFEVKLDNSNNLFLVKYYPGNIIDKMLNKNELSDKFIECKMPLSFYPFNKNREYIMCHANDDAMSPFILEGDFVIIELDSHSQINNNKIYAFIYENDFYIRKIVKNINQLMIISDNKFFRPQYIEKVDMDKFTLLGHVVYIGRTQK